MAEPHGNHERADVRVRPVALFGAGLVALIVLVLAVTYVMMQVLLERAGEPGGSRPEFTIRGRSVAPPMTAGPSFQTDPARDLREFRAREQAALTSYGWVDRQAGRVRIPVERAMELLLERGAGRLRPQGQP